MNKFLFLLEQILLEGFDDRKITHGDFYRADSPGEDFIKGIGIPDLSGNIQNSQFFLKYQRADGSNGAAKVKNYAFNTPGRNRSRLMDYAYKAVISRYSDIHDKIIADDKDDRFVFFYKVPNKFDATNEDKKLAQFIQAEFLGGFKSDTQYNNADTARLKNDIEKKNRLIARYIKRNTEIEKDKKLSSTEKREAIKDNEEVIKLLQSEVAAIYDKIDNLDHRITDASRIDINGIIDDIETVSAKVIEEIGSNSCTYGEYIDAVKSVNSKRMSSRSLTNDDRRRVRATIRRHELSQGREIYSDNEEERMEQIYAYAQEMAEEVEETLLANGFTPEQAAEKAEERYNRIVEIELEEYDKRSVDREAEAEAKRLERNEKAREWRIKNGRQRKQCQT